MNKKVIMAIFLFVVVSAVGIFVCYKVTRNLRPIKEQVELPSPSISTVLDQRFREKHPAVNNFNEAISMVGKTAGDTYQSIGKDDEFITLISFIVFNHTDEAVVFTNQGYNYEMYRLNSEQSNWENVGIIHSPVSMTIVLPPNLTEPSYEQGKYNIWEIFYDDLDGIHQYDSLRIYIEGRGEQSGQLYGAYFDFIVSIPYSE